MRRTFAICVASLIPHLGCNKEQAAAPDAGVEPRASVSVLVDSVSRMADERWQVQLLADLGAAFAAEGDDRQARRFLDQATSLAQEIARPSKRDASLRRVAMTLVRIGRLDSATQIAKNFSTTPDRAELLVSIVAAHAKKSAIAKAEQVAALIEDPAARGRARVEIAQGLAKDGKIERALEMGKTLTDRTQRNALLLAASRARVTRKRYRKGLALTKFMESGRQASEAYAFAAVTYMKRRRVDDALKLVDAVESESIRARTYAELSSLAARRGHRKRSRVLTDRAFELATGIGNSNLRDEALASMAEGFIAASRRPAALRALESIQARSSRHATLAKLVASDAKARRFKDAEREVTELVKDNMWGPEGVGPLALAYGRAGRFERAFEHALSIQLLELRLPILTRLAVIHTRAKVRSDERLLASIERGLELAPLGEP